MYNSNMIRNFIYKLSGYVVLISFLSMFIFPTRSHALIPPMVQFGGLANFTIPCTCSANLWVYFTPLYLSAVPMTGPLVYTPYATLPFEYFLSGLPGVWHLGSFIPGVQTCWFYIGIACIPIPSLGMMSMVGTSLPGAI
jgi:hypothetical protein